MGKFEIKESFYLNGEKFKIISGAFHYFRTVPEYWEDRLLKLKAMGCNTVESYIPWNLHEKEKGKFDFEGILDTCKFIETAAKLGLYVIIRPSPYICAEWEFGGIPYWLLKEDGMKFRVNYEPFMKHVMDYYDVLIPKLVPYLITNNGPIILMQIENEYGYYATDKEYLPRMKNMLVSYGVDVPFVTSDGPYTDSLNAGCIDGVLPTGNFGSKTEERFETLKKYTNGGPLMCTEFWVGWFDHWGNGGHMKGNLVESVKDLDKMLELGNVNIYMFEGGTNFGFMNGSNYYDELTPDVTSYDYDGVLTESGDITEKYIKYREVISKYTDMTAAKEAESKINPIPKMAYGVLNCTEKVSLKSVINDISTPIHSLYPISMERAGQGYGYTLYSSILDTEENVGSIRLWSANDRANIFIGDERVCNLYDRELLNEKKVEVKDTRNKKLDILMENMGRVNFGPLMEKQRKGIDSSVQINGHMRNDWDIYCLPLDNTDKIDFSKEYTEGLPCFYKFELEISDLGDTYLDFEGWGKGVAFVNGFNIGRFWKIGPQKRLYIPAPLLKLGRNEIIIFETDGEHRDTIELKNEPDIG